MLNWLETHINISNQLYSNGGVSWQFRNVTVMEASSLFTYTNNPEVFTQSLYFKMETKSVQTQSPATPVYILRGHTASIHALHIYNQNLRLISGDANGWIVVWDLVTKRPVASWKAHAGAVLEVRGFKLGSGVTEIYTYLSPASRNLFLILTSATDMAAITNYACGRFVLKMNRSLARHCQWMQMKTNRHRRPSLGYFILCL